ncbi:MAG: pyridoxal phosphate-dependent aminotransferase [Bacteroidales bacterium]|jgi:aspartate aminotransferase|nr:pyridoxal phosphate-dependent aminotransferase [Bacteroidales bacterium]MBQ5486014.1 pyridoxal phosphate-dependent aminotransferase [Bacteroidales bacterium]
MPKISARGTVIPASPIRKLTPFADAAKARGMKVYHLNIGQPDLPTPRKALDALKAIDRTTLEYSPSQGIKSLREKLSSYYGKFGIDAKPDDIIVTAGGSEALLLTFMACLNPGDEIIMTEPGYANYLSFAVTAGVTVKTVTSRIENGFALPSVEDFEAAITDKTKAILICNPNNPTGYLYSSEELFRLRDIVKQHDLFLFSDEVYREFRYTDAPYLSALNLEGIEDNVIVIDSVSKRYSECGIRIGMIVSHNKEVMGAILKFCQARLSPPLLGQIVAEASIEGTEEYSKECFDEYLGRRNFFIEGLNKIPGVYSPMPNGAFYTIASLPVEDAEDFCKWCLTDFCYHDDESGCTGETVMMAPAQGFYSTPGLGKNQVRMAYVLEINSLKRALMVLEKALEAYGSRG